MQVYYLKCSDHLGRIRNQHGRYPFPLNIFTNIWNGFLEVPLYYEVLTLKFHFVNLLCLFLTIANCLMVDVIICFYPSFMHISKGSSLSFFSLWEAISGCLRYWIGTPRLHPVSLVQLLFVSYGFYDVITGETSNLALLIDLCAWSICFLTFSRFNWFCFIWQQTQ